MKREAVHNKGHNKRVYVAAAFIVVFLLPSCFRSLIYPTTFCLRL